MEEQLPVATRVLVEFSHTVQGKTRQGRAGQILSSISHGQTKDDIEGERERVGGTVHGNIPTALTQRKR